MPPNPCFREPLLSSDPSTNSVSLILSLFPARWNALATASSTNVSCTGQLYVAFRTKVYTVATYVAIQI